MRPTTPTSRLVKVSLARQSTSTTLRPPGPAFASLSTSRSEEFAPTVTPDSTTTVTVTGVFASLATRNTEVCANPFVLKAHPTRTVNVFVKTECQSIMESAGSSIPVPFTLFMTRKLSAVSADLATE